MMGLKKTKKSPENPDREISLVNDYGDLKFSLHLKGRTPDGWVPYFCGLSALDAASNQFKSIFNTDFGSVVSEITLENLGELSSLLKQALVEKKASSRFKAETNEFNLVVDSQEDVYRVQASIDLCTSSPQRMEAGSGDSEISLTFNCTSLQLADFSGGLDAWIKGVPAVSASPVPPLSRPSTGQVNAAGEEELSPG